MSDTQTITLGLDDLNAMITNAVAQATTAIAAMMEQQVTAAPVSDTAAPVIGKTVNLSDAEIVARSKTAKKVSKFFKNGDANEPISYKQRKRLLAIAENGLRWEDMDGLTTAQGAVASFHLEALRPVRFGDLVIQPYVK